MVTGSICIIPARGGSRRIPRKNIKLFHGKPIIAYAIETARACDLFSAIYVSTEDKEIAAVSHEFGAEIIDRPPELAEVDGAHDCGTQAVMRHAISVVDMNPSEVACCLYPCAPLVQPYDLLLAFNMLTMRPCSYVVSVSSVHGRDIGNFYMGQARKFGVDALWSVYTGVYPMPLGRAIDINTESDWKLAEEMYAKLHR